MNNYQAREAFRIHADTEIAASELSLRDQEKRDRRARELRLENIRRTVGAS